MNCPSLREVSQRPFFWPLMVLVCFLLLHDHWSEPPRFDSHFLNHENSYQALLLKKPEWNAETKKAKLAVRLQKILQPSPQKIKEDVFITVMTDQVPWKKGDLLFFSGSLKEPLSYQNPGSFDYRRHLFRQGVSATSFVGNGGSIKVIKAAKRSPWDRWKEAHQKKILQNLEPQGRDIQGILVALLWGEEAWLSDSIKTLFRNHGLAHLLVISGSHFVTLSFLIYTSLLALGRLFPFLLLTVSFRKIVAFLTLIFVGAYYFFCEPSPSITRAFIGIACYLGALILGRSRDVLNILFLAAFLILVQEPFSLFDLSFQLSFLAVLSLILVFPWLRLATEPILEKTPERFQSFLKNLHGLILANIALTLGIVPWAAATFQEIQIDGVLMNLWAVPLIEFGIVPLGLLGLLVQNLSDGLASGIFSGVSFLIQGVLFILRQVDSWAETSRLVYPPHGWELILYYGVLLILVLRFPPRFKKITLIGFCLVMAGDISAHLLRTHWAHRFTITQLDVGQGDSVLIELPGPRWILIDGGGSPYFDLGRQVVIPYLLYQRIPRLDVVGVTHADTDHYLGLQKILERYAVGELWWNGHPSDQEGYQKIFIEAQKRGIPIRSLQEGHRLLVKGQDYGRVLSPRRGEPESSTDNERSLVLQVVANEKTALLTGDMGFKVEERLAQDYGANLRADFLKVPHHGSRSSSSDTLLRFVQPAVATIGVRLRNRFGHPHPSVVSRYENYGVDLYRTDRDGAIEVDLTEEVTIKTERTTLGPAFPKTERPSPREGSSWP